MRMRLEAHLTSNDELVHIDIETKRSSSETYKAAKTRFDNLVDEAIVAIVAHEDDRPSTNASAKAVSKS